MYLFIITEYACPESLAKNLNLVDVMTPINVELLEQLLVDSNYDKKETEFLVNGFSHGFHIGYEGPTERADTSRNLLFQQGIGDKWDLWTKVMKEVHLQRYAGPFDDIPFDNFIQSPIGLVPKAEDQTRLIFHLSYDFKSGNRSLNFHTPVEICSVKYNDIDHAVQTSFIWVNENGTVFYAKTDLKSAFRILGLNPDSFKWLVMAAENPFTGKMVYFVDKCLLFGSSISCSHFQRFSNALDIFWNIRWE